MQRTPHLHGATDYGAPNGSGATNVCHLYTPESHTCDTETLDE